MTTPFLPTSRTCFQRPTDGLRPTTKSDHGLSDSVRFTTYGYARSFFLHCNFGVQLFQNNAQALATVTTTLADVQAHLRTLITPSTILLGHLLERARCNSPLTVHRHLRDIPAKARTSMANAQVARSHHTGSSARRPQSRRGSEGRRGFTEIKD